MEEINHLRVSAGELLEQSKEVEELFKYNDLLKLVPDIVLILNSQRQIIYSNQNFLKYLNCNSLDEVIGKRAGEVFNCIHAFENELGCGSTEFCKECGAHKSILSSLNYQNDVKECRIIQKETSYALDLKIWTNPIVFNDKLYILFTLRDISNEKRREVLERIFFHDILNTATSIRAIMELIEMNDADDTTKYSKIIKNTTNKLFEEINTQRQLVAAESNTLNIELSMLNVVPFIQSVIDAVKFYDFAKNIKIEMTGESEDFTMITDKSLLGRVITNLLKNASEAESPNGEVEIGCKSDKERVHIWVHNRIVIPKPVQLQLFQRSFSTKGRGRGIGLYSVKLLTETYLKGKVSFISSQETGTIFNLYYPIDLSE